MDNLGFRLSESGSPDAVHHLCVHCDKKLVGKVRAEKKEVAGIREEYSLRGPMTVRGGTQQLEGTLQEWCARE